MSTTADSPKKSKSKPPKEKKTQPKSNDRLKIVVRRLPPNLPEEIFWQSVQEWVTDDTVSWKFFYGGKLKKKWGDTAFDSQ
jgi:regulator of nonsense transcripts 3